MRLRLPVTLLPLREKVGFREAKGRMRGALSLLERCNRNGNRLTLPPAQRPLTPIPSSAPISHWSDWWLRHRLEVPPGERGALGVRVEGNASVGDQEAVRVPGSSPRTTKWIGWAVAWALALPVTGSRLKAGMTVVVGEIGRGRYHENGTEDVVEMIRIGANPIGWSNDDMVEIGGETPLEVCLAEAREAGFSGMELGNKFPRRAEALRPVLEAHGHRLVSGWYSTQLLLRDEAAEIEAARDHAGLLRDMGCAVMIVCETSNAIHGQMETPLSARPVLPHDVWGRFGMRLTGFALRLRQEFGLTLVYHHHMGTIVQTEAEIDRLMALTGDAVHLLLDTGHVTWGGGDPARVARNHKGRIAHVHTKDVRADVMRRANGEDWSFLRSVLAGVYTVPGDGIVDFGSVFAQLGGYEGWVVVEAEQDPAKAHPLTYAKMGYGHLRQVLEGAGFAVAA